MSKPLNSGELIKQEIINGVTIRNLENSELLNQAFRRIFALVGIRQEQFPTKDETQLLTNFVRNNLGNYTVTELVLAFEMALGGHFKADLEHFGQFTVKYLSQVFNAYKELRNKIALEVQKEAERMRVIQSEQEAQKRIDEFYQEAAMLYSLSKDAFQGTKYHANVIYNDLKVHYTDEQLIDFKQKAGSELQRLKYEYESQVRKREPISDYLKGFSFTRDEWRRRTALLVVNDAIRTRKLIN